MKDYVDLDVDRRIDECEKEKYDIKGLDASDTIIQALENELKKVSKELNDLKLKNVEKQQEDFGEKSKKD